MRYLRIGLIGWGLCAFSWTPDSTAAEAKPFLSPLFNSHMVFPCEVEAPVWGWTEPGARVTVSMSDKSAEAVADAAGKWSVKLGPFPAGGPHVLTVAGPKGGVTLEDVLTGDVWLCSGQSNMTMGIRKIKDAEQEIAAATHPRLRLFDQPPWRSGGVACKWDVCTPDSIVRQGFATDEKGPDGKPLYCGFSATAYFFARELQKHVDVPLGLVQTSMPGTPIESWCGAGAIEALVKKEDEAFEAWYQANDPSAAAWSAAAFDDSAWQTATFPIGKEHPKFSGILWLRRTFEVPADWAGKELRLKLGWMGGFPSVWINGGFLGHANECFVPAALLKPGKNAIAVRVLNIHGHFGLAAAKPEEIALVQVESVRKALALAGEWRYRTARPKDGFTAPAPAARVNHAPAACRGSFGYRELIAPLAPFAFKGVVWYQGEANAARADVYAEILAGTIREWRALFPATPLPVLVAQLPNFKGKSKADETDIPALREAQAAVARTVPGVSMAVLADIGEEMDQHPKNKQEAGRRLALKALENIYGKKIESSGPVCRRADKIGAGIRVVFDHVGGGLKAADGELKGFCVAGADGQFVQAKATIDGDAVRVSAAEIAKPEFVRYGWRRWSPCDLYSKEGLPAEPFRTDALPLR